MPAAAVAAVATVGGAVVSSKATKKASNAQADATRQSLELQREIYGQNEEALSPFMQRGNSAGSAYMALLGLGGNQAASQQAFDNYRNSTGYQFRVKQGLEGVTQNRAVNGMLQSGSALKGLNDYAQNTASGEFNNYMGLLGNQQGVGLSAANALAGVGTSYANAATDTIQNGAAGQANAALAGAANMNGMFGNLAGIAGYASGGSSYGSNGSNALSGLFRSGGTSGHTGASSSGVSFPNIWRN